MSRRSRGPLPQRPCALKTCGKLFTPTRRDHEYCEPTHKTQAWRGRSAEGPPSGAVAASTVAEEPAPASAQAGETPLPDEVLLRRLKWQRQQRGEPPITVDPLLTVLAKIGAAQQLLKDPAVKALIARYEALYDRAAGVLPESELADADLAAVLDAAVTRLGLEVLRLDGRVSVVVVVARDPERAA